MFDLAKILGSLTAGYLLGSVNTAVIVGRIYGKDVKNLGSRSGGLTNALRVLGKTAAIFVLVGDVLKGVIACLIGLRLGVYAQSGEASDCVSLLAAGAGVIVGHNWPVYFGFKGGKGVLTGVSVLFMFDWRVALICLALFAAITAATRYVSLANICATLLFVALSFVPAFGHTVYLLVFACMMTGIIVFKHQENIQRLLSGTENRLAY